MIEEIALGLEQPTTIASRYGFDAVDYAQLEQQDWFARGVQARVDELKRNGWTYRAKMAMMAEDLSVDAWRTAKLSDSATVKLEVAKFLARMADLEPKDKTPAQQGAGFSISIQINNPAPPIKTVAATEPADILGEVLRSLDNLPPPPSYLSLIPYEALTVPYEVDDG
jgi:hypothetical protein